MTLIDSNGLYPTLKDSKGPYPTLLDPTRPYPTLIDPNRPYPPAPIQSPKKSQKNFSTVKINLV